MWTRVNSGRIDLPLPIDSCFSVSLVSGAHTDHLLKTNSQLKYTPLADLIPVAVANPTAQLKAIGTMEAPITFANEHTTTFLMLSVPGLAWPILYGENHLQITNALVDHQALTITFRHPSLNATIKCQKGNPLHAFPHLTPANLSTRTTTDKNASSTASSAQVTCLLTGLPSPNQLRTRIQINRGLNIITICLFLTSSLIGSTYFSDSWLEGQKLNPDMEVISGPTNLSYSPSSVQLLTPPFKAKRKCTPSQPLQDSTTNTYEPNSNYATVFWHL